MKKNISLIKVSLNHDMNIFKINTKKQSKINKIALPLVLALYIMGLFAFYANNLIVALKPIHLEYVVLTLFAFAISLLTVIEGIYKSGPLLFNCKDDQLLFSLPIKKSTVLFVRILKFYLFEFLYNSLFILPAIIVYAYHVHPTWTYYLLSVLALVLLPIIPIAISCILGFIITYISSRFKGKNFVQTVLTIIFLLGIFYFSYNLDGLIDTIESSANSANNFIIKIYYPVKQYISLVNNFDIKTLFSFIFSNLIIFACTIWFLGKIYFKVNSSNKRVLVKHRKNNKYVIKKQSRVVSFVKKELNRFFNSPVFITNAGFGLVLFLIACIYLSVRFDSVLLSLNSEEEIININTIKSYLPVVMFGLVSFSALLTSITSSMISLEGRSFNILKSLPIKPFKIVLYKVITALVIMIPCFIIGDFIIFIRFKFDILSILLILIASFLLPFVTELIGIMFNLKYPKMDATNDTEVIKQSMSSMASVFTGMGLLAITIGILVSLVSYGLEKHLIMLIVLGIYGIISFILCHILSKNCDRYFNDIVV